MLINHMHVTTPDLPPFGPYLCEYLTAANGVFVRAKRPGMEVQLPVCLNFTLAIRGLASLAPYIRLEAGPIPETVIAWALDAMAQAAPRELLAWVNWAEGYNVSVPEQTTTTNRCKPLDPLDPLGQTALLDFHSHGQEKPFFSTLDNRDERQGFRLFAVAGGFPTPSILLRVGIYGHFWQIPPQWVMELPEGLAPAYEGGLPCLD